ncbi:hypothetical protein ACLKA7_000081 [Drosophila subpalustris]
MRAVNEKGIDIDDIASTSGATQGGMHGSCARMGGTQGFGAASVHAERAALKMNTGPVLANGARGHGGTDVPLTEMKTTDAGRGVNTVQVNKLPIRFRIDWSRYVACIRLYPNIKNFGNGINQMAMDVSRATLATASSKQHGKGDQQSNQKAVMPTSTDAPHKMEQKGRFKCKGNHILEKWHCLKSWKKKQECGISDCKSYHHHLLHKNKSNQSNVEQKETPKHQATETVNTIKSGTSKLLFKVLPVEVTGPNGLIVETFTFVDEGLKSTCLGEDLVAAKTPLGWLVYESTQAQESLPYARFSVVFHTHAAKNDSNTDMHKLMTDYFGTESFGVKVPSEPLESSDVTRARKLLVETTRKLGNAYETGLLWSEDDRCLNNEDDNEVQTAVQLDNKAVNKILGMFWESHQDILIFDLKMNRVDKDIVKGVKYSTKRQLLSLVKSVYDPFGMLADLMIYGKILVQDVWRTGICWNDLIPDDC